MSIKAINEQGALVPARNLSSDLFVQFDRADEDQIVAELMGGVVEEYAYQFSQGGQTVTGLSLAGVMAVAQNMGGIVCGEPKWEVSDEEYYCEISATDHHRGLTVWGNAIQPRYQQTRNGAKLDQFARMKALSKAQRNAIRKVIPETVATEMIKQVIGKGRPQPPRRPASAPRVQQVESETGAETVSTAVTAEVVDVETGEIQDAALRNPSASHPASDKQIKAIFAIARNAGWKDSELREVMLEKFGVEHSADLTIGQASAFIDFLKGGAEPQQALNV